MDNAAYTIIRVVTGNYGADSKRRREVRLKMDFLIKASMIIIAAYVLCLVLCDLTLPFLIAAALWKYIHKE